MSEGDLGVNIKYAVDISFSMLHIGAMEKPKKTPDKRVITPMPEIILAGVDRWRAARSPIPSQSQAIRELLVKGLQVDGVPL